MGFCVADRPMRASLPPVNARSRSSDSAKCAPRLLPASAWISSTITVRVVASVFLPDSEPRRCRETRSRNDDVRRTAAHAGALGLGSVAGAYQRADLNVGQAERAQLIADARERHFEIALDVIRKRLQSEMYTSCVSSASALCNPLRTSSSMAVKNAAKVFPDPVGAAIRTCLAARIAGQACSCAGVGASKLRRNQAATAG